MRPPTTGMRRAFRRGTGTPVAVRVIRTDEESVIAASTMRVLGLESTQER